MTTLTLKIIWSLLFFLVATTSQFAPAQDTSSVVSSIVNGSATTAFPTVGSLLTVAANGSDSFLCTGTLIGCSTFLTAAHCMEDQTPQSVVVYIPGGGIFNVQSFSMHPDFEFPLGDVAVVKLSTQVNGLSPSRINDVSGVTFGSEGTLVGYGLTGEIKEDSGIKRTGEIATQNCNDSAYANNEDNLCWRYTGEASTICFGDSGGPTFIFEGGQEVVAGVHSGIERISDENYCTPGDISYDANVFSFKDFIRNKGGRDIDSQTCGNLPQVGSSEVNVQTFSGRSSLAGSLQTVSVPQGTKVLRVAMNAAGDDDTDIYVKGGGSQASPQNFDCESRRDSNFEFCEIQNPAPGTYSVSTIIFRGIPANYQLTATLFGASPGFSCGDANGDGSVSVTDGVIVLRAAAELPSPCTLDACDVDRDGRISVTDGVLVLRKAAELPVAPACLNQ